MTTPPRRPGGSRPLPQVPNAQNAASRGGQPPQLYIPPGNVPGINVDQAGHGGWQQPRGLPSFPPERPRPRLATANLSSSHSTTPATGRPQLSISLGMSRPPPPPPRLNAAPHLSLPLLATTGPESAQTPRAPRPGLSLSIPTGVTAYDEETRTARPSDHRVARHPNGDAPPSAIYMPDPSRALERQLGALRLEPGRQRSSSTASSTSSIDGFTHDLSRDPSHQPANSETERLPPDWVGSIVKIRDLSEGSFGAVDLVQAQGKVMARKTIPRGNDNGKNRQLWRELRYMSETQSNYIVNLYEWYTDEQNTLVTILMEYCEGGSLEFLINRMKSGGYPLAGEKVIGRIALSVLSGLNDLHKKRIIHRDIKPANILATSDGNIKLCDLGVAGELVNSNAGTWIGTTFYMAPERIMNQGYTITSDVWSLGLTLYEIAHLHLPFETEGIAPVDLTVTLLAEDLEKNVREEKPYRRMTAEFVDLVAQCLVKDGTRRPYPRDLLNHPFVVTARNKTVDMRAWVAAYQRPPAPR